MKPPMEQLRFGPPTSSAYLEISLPRLEFATEPSLYFREGVAQYADRLDVSMDAMVSLLVQNGRPESSAKSLRLVFIDGETMDRWFKSADPNIKARGYSEPAGKIIPQQNAKGETYCVQYDHYIGLRLEAEALTPAGIAQINKDLLHELGHYADPSNKRKKTHRLSSDGEIVSYSGVRLLGAIPLPFVASLITPFSRGGKVGAQRRLDSRERFADEFADHYADLSLIKLRR